MPGNHRNANQTPAQQRSRRGPAFLLNHSSSYSSSGHQFASPPRFLLSQNTPRAEGSSQFHHSAAFSPFGGAAVFSTPGRSLAVSPEKIDDLAIEDDVSSPHVNYEIDEQDEDIHESESDVDMSSSELDDLFSPRRNSKKRRRTFSSPSKSKTDQPYRASVDEINDSISPGFPPSSDPVEDDHAPVSPFLNHQPLTFQAPAPTRLKTIPEPHTPRFNAQSINLQSSFKPFSAFHSPPRYIVSANYTPSGAPHASTPATITSASTRKKPMFVLPRSPSPDPENANLDGSQPPTSFSPTLIQKLHRRGRSTSSGTYVLGGLAEQLRDWILEKGAERERTMQRQVHKNIEAPFVLTANIDTCRNAYLKSSGPVTIARVTPVITGESEEPGDKQTFPPDNPPQKDILLIGAAASHYHEHNRHSSTAPSISAPGSDLKPGDMIRIRAGLTWEIELDSISEPENEHDNKVSTQRVIASSQSPSWGSEDDRENEEHDYNINARPPSTESARKTWLVAAEWTRLS